MTRQVTDQLYVELGYFTPEEYYVYTAEAVAALSGQATFTCQVSGGATLDATASLSSNFSQTTDVSKTVDVGSVMTVTASVSATISHIHGADLFAFSDAQLAAQASVIRETNIALMTQFSATADAARIRYITADANSQFTESAAGLLFRDYQAALTAAFSTSTTVERFRETAIFLPSQFSLTASTEKIVETQANINSQFTINISIQRNRFADGNFNAQFNQITSSLLFKGTQSNVNSQFNLSADANKNIGIIANISSQAIIVANVSKSVFVNSIVNSQFTISADGRRPSRYIGEYQLVQGDNYGTLAVSNQQSKFGGYSLKFGANERQVNNFTNVVSTGSQFAVLGKAISLSTIYIATSTDGITWTRSTTNLSLTNSNMAFGDNSTQELFYLNGRYILLITDAFTGIVTDYIYSSTNGTTWTQNYSNVDGTYRLIDLDYSATAGSYRLINENGYVDTSTNLTTWTTVNSASPFIRVAEKGISSKGNATVVCGAQLNSSGVAPRPTLRYSSNTGSTWTATTIGTVDNYFYDITNDGTTWVAVGGLGIIYSSTNGTSWTQQTSNTTSTLDSIKYLNGVWIASGSGITLTSTNLTTWTNANQAGTRFPAYNSSVWLSLTARSTNGTTWAQNVSGFGMPNQTPYIQYGDYAGWTTWKTVDFWFYTGSNFPSSAGGAGVYFELAQPTSSTSTNNGWRIQLTNSTTSGKTTIQWRFDSTGTWLNAGAVNNLQWNHLRVSYNSGTLSIYINGSRILNTVVSQPANQAYPLTIGGYRGGTSNPDFYIDELLITGDLLTDPSVSSFSVPTAEYSNTIDTSLLLHFNGFIEDDASQLPKTQQGIAAISGLFNLVNSADKFAGISENLNSQFTFAILADAFNNADAQLVSSTTLSVSATNIKQVDCQTNSQFQQTTSAIVLRDATANINSQFSQTVDVNRIRDLVIATDAIFSELAAVAKVGDFLITLESQTNQTTQAVKTATTSSQFTNEFSININVVKAVFGAADINASASMSISADRTRDIVSNQSSEFNQSVDAVKSVEAISSQTIATSIFAEAIKTTETQSQMSAQFNCVCAGIRVRYVNSNQNSAFTSSSIAVKITEATSSPNSQFNLSIPGERLRPAEITTNSIFSELAAAAKVGRTLVTIESQATLSAIAIAIPYGSANLTTTAQIITNASKIVKVPGNLAVVSNLYSEGTTNIVGEAAITATSTLTLDADVKASAAALVMSAGTMTVLGTVTRRAQSQMSALAFELGVGERNRGIVANLTTTSTLAAIGGGLFKFQANMQGFASTLTVGNVIHITPALTYKIRSEDRDYRIREEDRDYAIRKENRTYKVKN